MKRRTVELGRVRVEGFRLQGEGAAEEHFVSIRLGGRVVEFPVSTSMAKTVRRLYGYNARLALLVEVGDPTKAKHWREHQAGEPKPPTPPPAATTTAKPKKPARRGGRKPIPKNALRADRELLARALKAIVGSKTRLGPAVGGGHSTYYNIRRSLDKGNTMTASMRAKLDALVEGFTE